ncbi:methyltransferase domain-containing protein [candidate division KSB1 bacterium]|nr:methyltransferase domain-containing protein [candidate division KSB1 bacterium]
MDDKNYYEAVAEEANLWEVGKRDNRYYQDMIRFDRILQLLPKTSQKILDLGCGDGYLSYLMAKEKHQVTALDLSQNRLEKFKDLAAEFGIEQKIGDVKNTGLPDDTYQLIICSEVLEHIEEYEKLLEEAFRILKPGGQLIVSVPHDEPRKIITCPHCLKQFYRNGHINRFSRQSLSESLQEHGFQILKKKVIRSKILNQFQYHLKLKYSLLLKFWDSVLSFLFPKYTFYLIFVAQKPNL